MKACNPLIWGDFYLNYELPFEVLCFKPEYCYINYYKNEFYLQIQTAFDKVRDVC